MQGYRDVYTITSGYTENWEVAGKKSCNKFEAETKTFDIPALYKNNESYKEKYIIFLLYETESILFFILKQIKTKLKWMDRNEGNH